MYDYLKLYIPRKAFGALNSALFFHLQLSTGTSPQSPTSSSTAQSSDRTGTVIPTLPPATTAPGAASDSVSAASRSVPTASSSDRTGTVIPTLPPATTAPGAAPDSVSAASRSVHTASSSVSAVSSSIPAASSSNPAASSSVTDAFTSVNVPVAPGTAASIRNRTLCCPGSEGCLEVNVHLSMCGKDCI